MKTTVYIIGMASAFFFSQGEQLQVSKETKVTLTQAQQDSIFEAGRVAKMKSKFI